MPANFPGGASLGRWPEGLFEHVPRQTDFIRVRLDNRYIKLLIMIKVIISRTTVTLLTKVMTKYDTTNHHLILIILMKKIELLYVIYMLIGKYDCIFEL